MAEYIDREMAIDLFYAVDLENDFCSFGERRADEKINI